ncbi:immunity protein YezG family protein [Fictibacillus sp. S7]|uniref:immunity protein YezG family protein n=1 Tax=Fictibacillus sp. S7 TaxID=2212476 RepID=UPI001010FF08|nr:hypothetical protein DMO16_13680 [Fictibacillus sp. S7]
MYALFYYVSKESNKLIYSHNIPKLFNVEQDNYDEMYHNLYFLFGDLRSEFIKNQQEVWTSLTFTKLTHNLYFPFKDYDYHGLTGVEPNEHQKN